MAKFMLKAGAELDMLTKDELSDALRTQADATANARGQGLKHLTFRSPALAAISTTACYVVPFTPNQGYVWSLRFVGAYLSAAQTISFFLNPDVNNTVLPNNSVGALGVTVSGVLGSLTFGSGNVLIEPEQYVAVAAGGSATLNSVVMQVWEAPAELAWKLA